MQICKFDSVVKANLSVSLAMSLCCSTQRSLKCAQRSPTPLTSLLLVKKAIAMPTSQQSPDLPEKRQTLDLNQHQLKSDRK